MAPRKAFTQPENASNKRWHPEKHSPSQKTHQTKDDTQKSIHPARKRMRKKMAPRKAFKLENARPTFKLGNARPTFKLGNARPPEMPDQPSNWETGTLPATNWRKKIWHLRIKSEVTQIAQQDIVKTTLACSLPGHAEVQID